VEKPLGLVDRLQCAIGREPALLRALLVELLEGFHAAILAPE
jgi:hypothetical protein